MQGLSDNNTSVLENNNFIQALDVRTKMLFCILGSVTVVFIQSWYPLTILCAASFVYVLAHKRFSIVLVAYLAVGLMCMIAFASTRVMFLFMPTMGEMGLGPFLNPFLRVLILLNLVLSLAMSSRVQEVLTVLKSLHLPLCIYLPSTVMIRFIPSFINDVRLIRESLKIKGYSINPLTLTLHPALALRLLFAPIVFRALRSSDELAVAAELKGVGYAQKMTFISKNQLKSRDYYALGYAFILVLLALNFQLQFITG